MLRSALLLLLGSLPSSNSVSGEPHEQQICFWGAPRLTPQLSILGEVLGEVLGNASSLVSNANLACPSPGPASSWAFESHGQMLGAFLLLLLLLLLILSNPLAVKGKKKKRKRKMGFRR